MDDSSSNYEFTRELEVETTGTELKLLQYSVGDVGSVVWDAGIVLGKYLDHVHDSKNNLNGKIVIDVGSGTGVAGLFAAALGAEVILTDLPEVVPLLEKNIELNKAVLKGAASASVLEWGKLEKIFPIPDLILVSDCIYYEMSVKKLVPTLNELSDSDTDILISYEDRVLGNKKELLKNFLDALKQYFSIEIIPKTLQHPDFQSDDIHLLKCKKKINSENS
ncbi:protein-lysine methyltransferase METTL21D [Trichonephila clavata]|uniref:Protein-lysine methyltransferase METTL21D n=1 Tax=Trichonephila clavata TaxID=2740835 RepID=A0A8X6I395_TRICU|nr:protein-lysine methyltransferase METTL21D [Trichonephila clavata]